MTILYTNHCPRCLVLENKLKEKHVPYEVFTDVKEMIAMGMKEAPMLQVDETIMGFKEAMEYIGGM